MKSTASVSNLMNAIARRIDAIQRKGALQSVDIANVLGTRPETVSRWNQGKAFPQPDKEKLLLELEYVVDQLADFYEPMEARLWLFARQKLLNGERPADLIQAGRTDELLRVIGQLRDSVYV
jgi:hypothetical protein